MTENPGQSYFNKIAVSPLSIRWGVLLLGIYISGGIILGVSEPWAGVIGLALLTGTALIVTRLDILHPYTWFSPFFFLYSASVPALIWMGVRPDIGSLQETVLMEWIALSVFLVVVGPSQKQMRISPASVNNVNAPSWFLFILSLGTSALYLIHLWSSGLTSKFEIALSSDLILHLDSIFSVLTLVFAVLLAKFLIHKRFPWMLILFTIGWMVFAFFLSGERDFVFKTLWVTLFLVVLLYRRISRVALVAMAICGLILVPILGDLKNILLREGPVSIHIPNPANLLFADEFVSASENLQLLIQKSPLPFYPGETLLWDLEQTFLPGFLFRSGPAPTTQFNLLFFPEVFEQGGGRGFTLVGEGYMNFGAVGVALWYLLLGLFVRYLYSKGSCNFMWLIIYIVSMPIIVYATRADFSNILSPFIKHMVLPVIVILIGERLVIGCKWKDNEHKLSGA
jgi:oligosaccharide repeat unit polymerase